MRVWRGIGKPDRTVSWGSGGRVCPKLFAMTETHSWPGILAHLLAKSDLDRPAAAWAMNQIMAGESADAQIGAFMIGLRGKGESVAELAGLVDVMLERCVILDTGDDAVDIVGTGGDLVGTVNVSSMASILTSAAGVPVMKHGSRSASGKTGSSEMLEVLGVRLDLSPERVADIFREIGLTFFFAPVFHPAMRHVAPIRKQLGVPTTFNFLGPLANPAQPIATSLGVANASVAPLMAAEMAARSRTALVFRGNDGLDELTTTDDSSIWEVTGGEVRQHSLDPRKFGLNRARHEQLLGGDAHYNAQVCRDLFEGNTDGNLGAVRDIVVLNSAAGVVSYELAKDASRVEVDLNVRFADAIERVTRALESGAAREKLSAWIAATQS
jgi:anthranilate phosphoribosyltransferase